MKTLVFGSANIDRTFSVPHIAAGGETIAASKLESFCGGKGFNQAIAIARAGCEVYFAGAIGEDGLFLKETLAAENINVDHLYVSSAPSGQAIIQVAADGQNSIIILAGANGTVTPALADTVLSAFSAGDLIVLQNEITSVDYILAKASEKGMLVALNPSPFNEKIAELDLSRLDFLILNEIEGSMLTGKEDHSDILRELHRRYPAVNILLTLGSAGSLYLDKSGELCSCGIYPVSAVDTTGAGDTFTGYFLASVQNGMNAADAMKTAAVASGISVSRKGASSSVPTAEEVSRADFSLIKECLSCTNI